MNSKLVSIYFLEFVGLASTKHSLIGTVTSIEEFKLILMPEMPLFDDV